MSENVITLVEKPSRLWRQYYNGRLWRTKIWSYIM